MSCTLMPVYLIFFFTDAERIGDIITKVVAPLKEVITKIAEEVAPLKNALGLALQAALDPWDKIYSETKSAVIKSEVKNLDPVLTYYGIEKNYCMVLGVLPMEGVDLKCAHIWPKWTKGAGLDVCGLSSTDVNNARNFLRLESSLEVIFDHKQAMFVINEASTVDEIVLELVILDPNVLEGSFQVGNIGMYYENFHRKPIHYKFLPTVKPFLRLLAMHSLKAIDSAVRAGWMADPGDNESRDRAYSLARYSLGEETSQIAAFLNTKR